jgi:ankyrin repeat protein
MSKQTPESVPARSPLPDAPSLEWLRKEAKRHFAELRKTNPAARLADAQFDLARQYGFPSWRALKAHIDALTVEGQLFTAAREGDAARVAALLDAHPEKLGSRLKPYAWTLLHVAAHAGRLPVVDQLLRRGLDVNTREKGDNTYAMHWAAAAGHLDVVRRLADGGGDVIGQGDDHRLQVIGWATCWDGCDDDVHRAIADLLISRGARHHIFSAIAMNLESDVRGIVSGDPASLHTAMSRNENFQLPLHFAVRMNKSEMVALLLELGADPAATDGSGVPAVVYAAMPNVDRPVIEILARHDRTNLFVAVALGQWDTAARLMREKADILVSGGVGEGVLHLMAKRGDARAVKWLLDHGADPKARWNHWDAEVTPLHLSAMLGHADVVRLLLEAGADPNIRDSRHDGDAIGWAEHGGHAEIVRILKAYAAAP